MFKNYFKTALRSFRRNKSYALINTFGLSVGIAACSLIFLVIRFESSFDNFHPNKKKIYRISTEFHNEDGVSYSEGSAFPVATALRVDFPQIKNVASIYKNGGQVTVEEGANKEKKFQEDNFYYAEPQFFSMFNFPFIAGNAKTALNDPNSAVLTEETAEKYFGNWENALGKTIKYGNKTLFTVKGILKNIPPNSDFPLSVVVSYSALKNTSVKNNFNDWVTTFSDAYTFVTLPSEMSVNKFDGQLKDFAKRHKPAEYANDNYIAEPLSEIHFDERFGNFTGHTFSHSLITALSVIGIFLIIIACVNFVNLATAQAVNRAKEVGVRKVLGSNRKALVLQFIGETALIVFFAIILSILIAEFTLPWLNHLLDVQISGNFISDPMIISFIVILGIIVTLLSGLYPGIILSGFNPITALKSKVTAKMVGGISLRRALVVVQFVIAQVLIIGMFVVVSQMNFFRNASLGFNKANIVNVPLPKDSLSHTKTDYIRDQLLKNSNISDVSFSFASPVGGGWKSDFKFNHSTKTTDFNANLKWADPEYFKTYNLKFIAGRSYYPGDSVKEFVVNETLLKKLGITNPKEAIGKQIDFWDGSVVGNIVGVIKDFNSYSLRQPMAPVVLSTWKSVYQTINIKIKAGAEKAALPFIENLWKGQFPDYAYDYNFLDKTIDNFYKHENELSQLYKIFAGIAIFISCLGLYGLVSFMAVQRTKEVGIRKVLGASARSIIYLLSKEFTVLILIAFVISAPIAWYIMHHWLQNYTYRIPLSASIFILAIFSSVFIAWITVAYRAITAAMANPVKSLRSE